MVFTCHIQLSFRRDIPFHTCFTLEVRAPLQTWKSGPLSHILIRLLSSARSVTFWTDSMIVLGYIRNISRRFKTFVANRLSIIQELSTADQWRHIDTKSNPADVASRCMPAEDSKRRRQTTTTPDNSSLGIVVCSKGAKPDFPNTREQLTFPSVSTRRK
jgi:hypothetical protein